MRIDQLSDFVNALPIPALGYADIIDLYADYIRDRKYSSYKQKRLRSPMCSQQSLVPSQNSNLVQKGPDDDMVNELDNEDKNILEVNENMPSLDSHCNETAKDENNAQKEEKAPDDDDEIENVPYSQQFPESKTVQNGNNANSSPQRKKKFADIPPKSPKRQSKPWAEEEEQAIVEGLKKYGLGNWDLIHKKYETTFLYNERTVNDIKMKWMRMKVSPRYHEFADSLKQPSKVAKKQIIGQKSIIGFFQSDKTKK